jgi:hypothetical protein
MVWDNKQNFNNFSKYQYIRETQKIMGFQKKRVILESCVRDYAKFPNPDWKRPIV